MSSHGMLIFIAAVNQCVMIETARYDKSICVQRFLLADIKNVFDRDRGLSMPKPANA